MHRIKLKYVFVLDTPTPDSLKLSLYLSLYLPPPTRQIRNPIIFKYIVYLLSDKWLQIKPTRPTEHLPLGSAVQAQKNIPYLPKKSQITHTEMCVVAK